MYVGMCVRYVRYVGIHVRMYVCFECMCVYVCADAFVCMNRCTFRMYVMQRMYVCVYVCGVCVVCSACAYVCMSVCMYVTRCA